MLGLVWSLLLHAQPPRLKFRNFRTAFGTATVSSKQPSPASRAFNFPRCFRNWLENLPKSKNNFRVWCCQAPDMLPKLIRRPAHMISKLSQILLETVPNLSQTFLVMPQRVLDSIPPRLALLINQAPSATGAPKLARCFRNQPGTLPNILQTFLKSPKSFPNLC